MTRHAGPKSRRTRLTEKTIPALRCPDPGEAPTEFSYEKTTRFSSRPSGVA